MSTKTTPKALTASQNQNVHGPKPELDKYLTKLQIAELLHVTPRTVNNYVATGVLPAPIHVGRLALWSKSALAQFLAKLQSDQ
jgi:hypothetical protein